jgi:hypothetical protein
MVDDGYIFHLLTCGSKGPQSVTVTTYLLQGNEGEGIGGGQWTGTVVKDTALENGEGLVGCQDWEESVRGTWRA